MKKYFSWIACGALVLCALIFPNTGAAVAGKGNGRSEKVTTVQEVGEVLEAFGNDLQMMKATGEQEGAIVPLGKQFASESGKEYTSVTLEFETTYGYSVKMGTASSSVNMERSMTCYFTENEAFYEVSATIRSKASNNDYVNGENESAGTAMSIACKIYIGEEGSFVNFERFTGQVKGGEDPELPDGVLNKWIDLDDEAQGLLAVNDSNYQIMTIFGEYILNCESKDFDKTGNTYVLKEYWAKELCGKVLSADPKYFKNAAFSVNLNNKTSPFIRLTYTVKTTEEYGDDTYTMKNGQTLACRLKNINNTVIKFKVPDKVYSISDFE